MYKITYWSNGNKRKAEIKASDENEALCKFYLTVPHDDVISVEAM